MVDEPAAVVEVEHPAARAAALVDDDAVRSAVGDGHLGGDGVRLVLEVEHAVLLQPDHAVEERLCVAADQLRTPGHVGVDPFHHPVVERQHVEAGGLDHEQVLQLTQLVGHLRGQVVGLGPVRGAVVQLPHVLVERDPGCRARATACGAW